MADTHPNGGLRSFSRGLYLAVINVIGSETSVKYRRMASHIMELLAFPDTFHRSKCIPSGSFAEGFNFESSDMDLMWIDPDVIVINSNSRLMSHAADFQMVLHMETENVPPGFTLLKCVRYDYRFLICMPIGNDLYYSSKIAREFQCIEKISSNLHGPCQTFSEYGFECDNAYALQCKVWPSEASSFIHRSLCHGWPSQDDLTKICKDGCLLVPIDSKRQICKEVNDLEWRISFSLAEKKMIHSMNHCQFLCYGLMKIFLNEVLKEIPGTRDALCSYFMKTAVFWEASECPYNWSHANFFDKFWYAFRRLIKWVNIGYCPNFLIQKHNMFANEIYGSQQRKLLSGLRSLYDEGYQCLLCCTSLHLILTMTECAPSLIECVSTLGDFFYIFYTGERKSKSCNL